MAHHPSSITPALQPLPDQPEQLPVAQALSHQGEQLVVLDAAEVVLDVGIQHVIRTGIAQLPEPLQRHLRAAPGRNPYEHGPKSASKMGSSTSLAAICTTRSCTVGMPKGRLAPSAFGM